MKNQWISLHIFYYGNQNQLLVSCIAPLIAQLRAQGLIQRYFFIKYWAEGPHIRLRLLPAVGADEEKIKYLSEAAITTFLKLRPALYSINHEKIAPIYKKLFIAEYGEAAWLTTYGEDGVMPLRPNNSFAYIPYIPETVRYGGPVAMELAEWHFEHSSDTVIGLLQQTNVGVHTMLLGRAVQLTLPFFYSFFGSDSKAALALDRYRASWIQADPKRHRHSEQYEKKYQQMASLLDQRVAKIRHYMLEQTSSVRLTETEEKWKSHLGALRTRIDKLSHERRIILDQVSEANHAPTPDDIYHYLLSSYVHMTNNRLGISIPEEIYIAYLLKRTLMDGTQRQEEEVTSR